MREYLTRSPLETQAVAEELARLLRPGDLLAYRGGLGMGKTTFTQGLAKGLGLKDAVSSPTFAYINEYRDGPIPLIHMDLYRIRGFEDLCSIGFFEYLDAGAVIAVEWSENAQEDLPDNSVLITFDRVDDATRRITVEGDDRF